MADSGKRLFDVAAEYYRAGNIAEAEGVCRDILAGENTPAGRADALHLLGICALTRGRMSEAAQLIREAIAGFTDPADLAEAYSNLGIVLAGAGDFKEAIQAHHKSVSIRPASAEAHNNLGDALQRSGDPIGALAEFERAVELRANYAEAWNNAGNAMREIGRTKEAVDAYRRALQIKPDFAEAANHLGIALAMERRPEEAVAAFERAIGLRPNFAQALDNLGNALKDIGRIDDALSAYERALTVQPGLSATLSNRIFAMHHHPDCDGAAILRECRRWNERFARPTAGKIKRHGNPGAPGPDRPLRIGYVSGDFRSHVVVWMGLAALFDHHDRGQFQIFGYSNTARPDDVTQRLRAKAEAWREIGAMSDVDAAELIRRDEVDILVDLSLHSGGNRLGIFAHKPAPVQVTYLAYAGTSGLDAMDYRLTDVWIDPDGADVGIYSEKLIRLPRSFWCYQVPASAPEVEQTPAVGEGRITFGCMNNYAKVSPAAWRTWGRLLARVENSRLLVHGPPGGHRESARRWLAEAGANPDRLSFVENLPIASYFRQYHQIDIALDPFQFGGGATTCDGLWMGVPAVSLQGQTAVGRGGASILGNLDLKELIAEDAEQYVRIAASLAADLPRLAVLRSGLRDRMRRSPLMDGRQFTLDIETAYLRMWREWRQMGAA